MAVTLNVDTFDDECEIKCHPEYAIQDKNTFLHGIKIYDVSVDDVDNRYRKILKDDFPLELYGFERQSEIDNYNNSLPSKEELEKYKEKLKIYLQCKEAGVCINIGIYNYGTAKASNVSAKIEFPEGVIVYDEGMFDSEGPIAPKVEKNPIELARERKKEHNIFLKTSSLVAAASMYAYNPSGAIMDMLTESHSDYEINGHGEYRNVDGEERLQVSQDRYVKINFASSGQQEAVWILNVVFYYLLNNKKTFFIIEEPESHLFPDAQKLMTEFISLAKNGGNKVLLTTHSPYILGTINNMLYANRISKKVNKSKVEKIMNRLKWLQFEKLSAYYVESGVIRSCLDKEFESIDNEVIDGVSDVINSDYDRMLELWYDSGMEVE